MSNTQPIKGYKVFNPDFQSKHDNFQYAENTEFKFDGKIKICASGFHFCTKASDCFSYYPFDPANIPQDLIDRHIQIKSEQMISQRESWQKEIDKYQALLDGKDITPQKKAKP